MHLGLPHASLVADEEADGLNAASVWRPQCLQSTQGTYVTVLPVSMMAVKGRGGVPRCSVV